MWGRVLPFTAEIFMSGFTLIKNRLFIFSKPEKTERIINRAQVAMVIAKTAIEVMILTPVIFRFENIKDKKPNVSDNNPLEIKRSEEHTSELQSRENLVCRLLLEKKKNKKGACNRK